jgi:hypothetical protein
MSCETAEEAVTAEERERLVVQAQELLEKAGYGMVLVIASGDDGTSISSLPEMSAFEIAGVMDFMSRSLRVEHQAEAIEERHGAIH